MFLVYDNCEAVITILATSEAAGIVNFDSSSDVTITVSSSGGSSSSTTAVINIVRGPGVYGSVNVPFLIQSLDNVTTSVSRHLTPSSGVVTFLDLQVSLNCQQLKAVIDSFQFIPVFVKKLLGILVMRQASS